MSIRKLVNVFENTGLSGFLARQAQKPNGWFAPISARMMNNANKGLEYLGLDLLELNGDEHILEIGFGNGRIMKEISNRLDSGKIHGIDISDKMLEVCSKKMKQEINTGKVSLSKASVEEIPFEDESFDKVFSCNTIYFWPEPEKNILEIKRLIKPGGAFICGFRTTDELDTFPFVKGNKSIFKNTYTEQGLQSFLEKAGFKNVEIKSQKDEPVDSHIAVSIR